MKISAPLLADRLALYATDAELRAAIFGARAKDPREGKQRKKNFGSMPFTKPYLIV